MPTLVAWLLAASVSAQTVAPVAPALPARVHFVQWSADPGLRQDWAAFRGAVTKADVLVMNLAPRAERILRRTSAGETAPLAAARALGGGGPGGQGRFTTELASALHGRGIELVNAESSDFRRLQGEWAELQRTADFDEALRRLAAIHARQGAELEASVRNVIESHPGRSIVVIQRLPYTFEYARLRADPSLAGEATFERTLVAPRPILFAPAEAAERRLLLQRRAGP